MTMTTQSASVLEPMLTIDDLALLTAVPKSTLYSLRSEGRGPRASKVGRSLRFRRSDVDAWLDQLAEEGAA